VSRPAPGRDRTPAAQPPEREPSGADPAAGGPDALLTVQRAAGNAAVGALLRGGGVPLPDGERRAMERSFGTGFGDVRLHTGAEGDTVAREQGARAVTVGHHVWFASGVAFRDDRAGRRVLAHELAHVVQQRERAGAPAPNPVSGPRDHGEREADAAAGAAAAGGVVRSPLSPAPAAVQRLAEAPARVDAPAAGGRETADQATAGQAAADQDIDVVEFDAPNNTYEVELKSPKGRVLGREFRISGRLSLAARHKNVAAARLGGGPEDRWAAKATFLESKAAFSTEAGKWRKSLAAAVSAALVKAEGGTDLGVLGFPGLKVTLEGKLFEGKIGTAEGVELDLAKVTVRVSGDASSLLGEWRSSMTLTVSVTADVPLGEADAKRLREMWRARDAMDEAVEGIGERADEIGRLVDEEKQLTGEVRRHTDEIARLRSERAAGEGAVARRSRELREARRRVRRIRSTLDSEYRAFGRRSRQRYGTRGAWEAARSARAEALGLAAAERHAAEAQDALRAARTAVHETYRRTGPHLTRAQRALERARRALGASRTALARVREAIRPALEAFDSAYGAWEKAAKGLGSRLAKTLAGRALKKVLLTLVPFVNVVSTAMDVWEAAPVLWRLLTGRARFGLDGGSADDGTPSGGVADGEVPDGQVLDGGTAGGGVPLLGTGPAAAPDGGGRTAGSTDGRRARSGDGPAAVDRTGQPAEAAAEEVVAGPVANGAPDATAAAPGLPTPGTAPDAEVTGLPREEGGARVGEQPDGEVATAPGRRAEDPRSVGGAPQTAPGAGPAGGEVDVRTGDREDGTPAERRQSGAGDRSGGGGKGGRTRERRRRGAGGRRGGDLVAVVRPPDPAAVYPPDTVRYDFTIESGNGALARAAVGDTVALGIVLTIADHPVRLSKPLRVQVLSRPAADGTATFTLAVLERVVLPEGLGAGPDEIRPGSTMSVDLPR
jgi:hypothetical protein